MAAAATPPQKFVAAKKQIIAQPAEVIEEIVVKAIGPTSKESPAIVEVVTLRPERPETTVFAREASKSSSQPMPALPQVEFDRQISMILPQPIAPPEYFAPQPQSLAAIEVNEAKSNPILVRVHEVMELPEESVEHTETLIQALPVAMQEGLVEIMAGADDDEPEVVATGVMLVEIATAADRLHELAIIDQLENPEAEELQQLLGEWYEESAIRLELEVDEESTAAFIELIKSEDFQPDQLQFEVDETPMIGDEPEIISPHLPVLVRLQEAIKIPEAAVEPTEVLLHVLPETFREELAVIIETAKPEVAVATGELVVKIAETANRLHELAMTERLDEPEAEQIKQLLEIWYEELAVSLELEVNQAATEAFIALICSEDYRLPPIEDEPKPPGDIFGEHWGEPQFNLLSMIGGVLQIEDRLQREIARLMVRHSTTPVALRFS